MAVKCVLIDDEPLAMVVIESYLDKFDNFQIIAKCDNAISAFDVLQKNEIDLIFLDIQMPKLTGIDFLKTLKNPPAVIITTAYREYAIEGYELDVLDYLVKPISFERFVKSINKFQTEYHKGQASSSGSNSILSPESVNAQSGDKNTEDSDAFIFVKENKKMVKINLDDVLYIESIKDYVRIQTDTKSVVTKQQISYYEDTLDSGRFLRIHRSFIVAIAKIEAFTATTVEIGKKELPIGRSYKTAVFEKLNYASDE